MAAGDIIKEFDMLVVNLTLKTVTGTTKGDVLAFDTDGYAAALRTAGPGGVGKAPFYVALETVTAPGSGQKTIRALARGAITVKKITGAINQGAKVRVGTTAGQVSAYAAPDAPSAYAEGTVQAELDKIDEVVGTALKAAASGDTTMDILLHTR